MKLFAKYFVLSALMLALLIVLCFAMFKLAQQEVLLSFLAAVLILSTYLGYTIQYYYFKNPKVKEPFRAMGMALKNIPSMIIPYMFSVIIFFIFLIAYNFAKLVPYAGSFISAILCVLYFSGLKIFFVELLNGKYER